MIWFNISKLVEKISKNELSEKDGYNYVLAFLILISIASMSIALHNESKWYEFSNCIISILITIWGFDALYKANLEIDGKDFFKRFFAIYWVVGMRLTLFIIILSIPLGIIMLLFSIDGISKLTNDKTIDEFIKTIIITLLSVYYFLLILKSFKRLKPIS